MKPLLKMLFRYSGSEFIIWSLFAHRHRKTEGRPPAGFIWVFVFYFALFGIASLRYENRIDMAENRLADFNTQLQSSYKSAFEFLPAMQKIQIPVTPNLVAPSSVFRSFIEEILDVNVAYKLKATMEAWKDSLRSVLKTPVGLLCGAIEWPWRQAFFIGRDALGPRCFEPSERPKPEF